MTELQDPFTSPQPTETTPPATRIPEKQMTRRSRIKSFRDLLRKKDQDIVEANELARVDSLTNLPNHRWFVEETGRKIAEAKRSGKDFWYLHMDIDKFKIINDQYTHEGANELLKLFGVLKLREEDQLARIGGDEFAMFIKGDTSPEDIAKLTERLREQLSALSLSVMSHSEINPNREFADEPIIKNVSFSFGATKFKPSEYPQDADPETIAKLLKERADRGTTHSKKEGRGTGTITEIVDGVERYRPMNTQPIPSAA